MRRALLALVLVLLAACDRGTNPATIEFKHPCSGAMVEGTILRYNGNVPFVRSDGRMFAIGDGVAEPLGFECPREERRERHASGICRNVDNAYYCKTQGFCTMRNGLCRAGSDTDCAQSQGCRDTGACSVTPNGRCEPESDKDCERSALCRDLDQCTFKDGVCIVADLAFCRERARKRHTALWGAKDGHCAAPTILDLVQGLMDDGMPGDAAVAEVTRRYGKSPQELGPKTTLLSDLEPTRLAHQTDRMAGIVRLIKDGGLGVTLRDNIAAARIFYDATPEELRDAIQGAFSVDACVVETYLDTAANEISVKVQDATRSCDTLGDIIDRNLANGVSLQKITEAFARHTELPTPVSVMDSAVPYYLVALYEKPEFVKAQGQADVGRSRDGIVRR